MSQYFLKQELSESIDSMSIFNKKFAELVATLQRTINNPNADGSNASAMELVMELKNHPYLGSSPLKVALNKIHSTLWKDAQSNLKAKLAKQTQELMELSPYQFKTKKKSSSKKIITTEFDVELEKDDP